MGEETKLRKLARTVPKSAISSVDHSPPILNGSRIWLAEIWKTHDKYFDGKERRSPMLLIVAQTPP